MKLLRLLRGWIRLLSVVGSIFFYTLSILSGIVWVSASLWDIHWSVMIIGLLLSSLGIYEIIKEVEK